MYFNYQSSLYLQKLMKSFAFNIYICYYKSLLLIILIGY